MDHTGIRMKTRTGVRIETIRESMGQKLEGSEVMHMREILAGENSKISEFY